jgi:hypothetical protein
MQRWGSTESEIITRAETTNFRSGTKQCIWKQPNRKKGSTYRQKEKLIERKADRIVTVLWNYRLIVLLNERSSQIVSERWWIVRWNVDWMSGEIWMPENIIRAKYSSGKKKLPIVQRVTNLRFIYLIERKNGWPKVEKPIGRRVRTDWKKCDSNEWWRKVFIKDEPISNVWKLLDGRNIQLKDWRKQIRIKRNCQSRRLYNFKEAVFDRKKEYSRREVEIL